MAGPNFCCQRSATKTSCALQNVTRSSGRANRLCRDSKQIDEARQFADGLGRSDSIMPQGRLKGEQAWGDETCSCSMSASTSASNCRSCAAFSSAARGLFEARVQSMRVGEIQDRHEQGQRRAGPRAPIRRGSVSRESQEPKPAMRTLRSAENGAGFAPGRQRFGMNAEAHRFAGGEETLAKLDPSPAIREPRPGARELRPDARARAAIAPASLRRPACGHWRDIQTATRGRTGRGRARRDAPDRESALRSRRCRPSDRSVAPGRARKTQWPGRDSESTPAVFPAARPGQ